MQGFLIANFIKPLLCQHIRDTRTVANGIFNSHSWTETAVQYSATNSRTTPPTHKARNWPLLGEMWPLLQFWWRKLGETRRSPILTRCQVNRQKDFCTYYFVLKHVHITQHYPSTRVWLSPACHNKRPLSPTHKKHQAPSIGLTC